MHIAVGIQSFIPAINNWIWMVSIKASGNENTKGISGINGVHCNYQYLLSPALRHLKKLYITLSPYKISSNLTSTRGCVLVEPRPLKHVQINVFTTCTVFPALIYTLTSHHQVVVWSDQVALWMNE